jgi:hypothetical protein
MTSDWCNHPTLLTCSLPGPSRRVVVEPIHRPVTDPVPSRPPAPDPPTPTEPVPDRPEPATR